MITDGDPKPERSVETTMFAEHYQFYIYDEGTDPGEFSIYWDQDSKDDMILRTDRLIGIQTARNQEVPVTVDIFSEEPKEEDLDFWDHVVQCSLEVPSGKLVVGGVTEDFGEPQQIEVTPGLYGVRIYWGALDEIDEDGFDGEDVYRVSLWPAEAAPEHQLLKEWEKRPTQLY